MSNAAPAPPAPGPARISAPGAIGTALLMWQDRIPRAPLSEWAEQLRERVARARGECREVTTLAEEAGTAGNNAALLAAHLGKMDAAFALCQRQLRWQRKLSRRAARPEIAAYCVQPWVNLARLESIAGDCDSAVSRLRLLRPQRGASSIVLQPLGNDGMGCQRISRSGDFAVVVENIYVIDTLKVLLQNRRFAEVFVFAEEVQRDFRSALRLWAREAVVVAACCLGDTDRARRVAQETLQLDEVKAWRGVLFRLRLAEVETCAGTADRAAAALGPLARAAGRLSPQTLSLLQPLYLLMGLATACLQAGLEKDASAVASRVYSGAQIAGDEIFQIQALRILAAASPADEQVAWRETLSGLEQRTEYRQYRARSLPPVESAAFEAMFAELSELYTL